MADHEFAIVGTGLLPALLAGCLAHRHGRRVALVPEPSPQYRLAQTLFASFGFWTRPESWALQRATRAEAMQLLSEIGGRQTLWKGSPAVRCHDEASARAMAHMMHVAGYFGLEMDKQAEGLEPGPGARYRIRGESFVHATFLWPRLFAWLRAGNVTIAEGAAVQVRRDGTASIAGGQSEKVVLTDSGSISTLLGAEERARHFDTHYASAILTEPVRMASPIVCEPATGFGAWQQLSGTVAITGNMPLRELARRAAMNLQFAAPARRAGEIENTHQTPGDGAPLVGRSSPSRLHIVSGLGSYGLFLMPSVARLLAGEATETELAYWAPRAPGRARRSSAIGEFSSLSATEAQA